MVEIRQVVDAQHVRLVVCDDGIEWDGGFGELVRRLPHWDSDAGVTPPAGPQFGALLLVEAVVEHLGYVLVVGLGFVQRRPHQPERVGSQFRVVLCHVQEQLKQEGRL